MRIIIAIGILFISSALSAQVKGYLGVRGGGHLSTAYIEHTLYNIVMNTGFEPGYHGGVMLKLFTNQSPTSFLNAGLQSGLLYESKGWRQSFATDEPTYKVRMNYINMPVEAVIYAGKRKTKYFFTLGVFIEKLVGFNKDVAPNEENIGGQEFHTFQENRDRDFGYGVRASLGAHRDFSFGAVHLDAFISYSASNFIRSTDFSERLPDLSNHYLGGFSVAYLIPFGKMEFSK